MSVRFFASAALRPQEEFDGTIAELLPRWIAVEFEAGRPRTGVWRSRAGARRVCWYRAAGVPFDHAAHHERYGEEGCSVVELGGDGVIRVEERDSSGVVVARRQWTFDDDAMPAEEIEFDETGGVVARRWYDCTSWRTVAYCSEARGPAWVRVEMEPPRTLPAAELAGEVYPCGGRLAGARLVDVLAQNDCEGRYVAAMVDGRRWRPAVVTAVAMKEALRPDIQAIIDFSEAGVAPELARGVLEHPRQSGFRLRGCVEAMPAGETLESRIERGPIPMGAAIAIAKEVGVVVLRAERRGHELGAIRPELVYVAERAGEFSLTGILHRGPALARATYAGEGPLVWPLYPSDFSSPNDVVGLAQLVWFMVTGTHPWYAPEHVRWQLAWDFRQESKRRRQPWTGPASLGPLLERVLFDAGGQAMSMTEFLGRLAEAGRG